MVSKSWVVTLLPLILAVAETLKTFVTGNPLNEQEVELVKYLFATFIGSGAVGAYLSARKP